MEKTYDIVVIGGGPGGYVAAIRAAQLGMTTALVEREHLGGICLNWGCIPTKSLLQSAEMIDWMKRSDEYGISTGEVSFDLGKIINRSRSVSKKLSDGISHLLKKNKVTVIEGEASLKSKGKIEVKKDAVVSHQLTAKHIIIATGARARQIPGLETDGDLIWTYKESMVPENLPKSLLVIGSGAIGMEFANFYNSLGTEVTVVEVLQGILPFEDEEISTMATNAFAKRGIKIKTGVSVTSLETGNNQVNVKIEHKNKAEKLVVDRVITAVGVTPNTENLGLKSVAVKLDDKGFIAIDEFCRTSSDGIYAIGDVAGAPCLAHKASHEAVICVEKIAGNVDVEPLDKDKIPSCTYTSPQVASIGLTEAQAIAKKYKVKVGRFPYAANGKAVAMGESEGLIKTIFDEDTGELLGAHMIGAEVTELISGYSIAKTLETTEKELMQTIFAHPTLSEMLHESVLDAYGHAIHI